MSADGTSMFCVEGYVNTPELSAGRGGGLSQGLPANGPYKSLFRARSESRGSNKAIANAPDAGLHVLADAAQSPEALSPPSAASPAPAPAPASKKRSSRKPSLLVVSSPALSVTPLDAVSATQSLPDASSNNASSSHVTSRNPSQRPPQAKQRGATGKGKSKEKAPPTVAPPVQADRSNQYKRHVFLHQQSGPLLAVAEPCETESTMQQAHPRNVQKNRAGVKEMSHDPQPPTPANSGSYDHGEDYYPSYYEAEPSNISHTPVAHEVRGGGQSLSPPPPKTWESPRPSSSTVNTYPAPTRTTRYESSPALTADSRPHHLLTPSTKPRMLTLLIEDRRNGTDELAEVRVQLKFADGYFWADAKEVCAALQSGPSRIDGESLLSPPTLIEY
jgi:hypothetical protein